MSSFPAPSRILVINVARIGDTLLTTPVLRALARAWPGAEITFAGHPKRIEIMQHLPFLALVRSVTKHRAPLLGRLSRGKTFDLALIYNSDGPLIEYGLRVATRVIAFPQTSSALNAKLYAIANPANSHPGNAVKLMLLILEPLQVPADGFHLSYQLAAAENSWAQQTLRAYDCMGRPLIGLQAASFRTKAHRDSPNCAVESWNDIPGAISSSSAARRKRGAQRACKRSRRSAPHRSLES